MSAISQRRPIRQGRGGAPEALLPPISPGMVGGRYQPLTPHEMMRIHHLVLQLLEDLGLSQVTPTLEARAVEAGCSVDGDGRLRFPRALIEDVIARTRRKLTLHGIEWFRHVAGFAANIGFQMEIIPPDRIRELNPWLNTEGVLVGRDGGRCAANIAREQLILALPVRPAAPHGPGGRNRSGIRTTRGKKHDRASF